MNFSHTGTLVEDKRQVAYLHNTSKYYKHLIFAIIFQNYDGSTWDILKTHKLNGKPREFMHLYIYSNAHIYYRSIIEFRVKLFECEKASIEWEKASVEREKSIIEWEILFRMGKVKKIIKCLRPNKWISINISPINRYHKLSAIQWYSNYTRYSIEYRVKNWTYTRFQSALFQ